MRLDCKLSDDDIRALLLVGTNLEADIRQVVGHAANYGADTYGDGDPAYLHHVVDLLREKWHTPIECQQCGKIWCSGQCEFKSNITWKQ